MRAEGYLAPETISQLGTLELRARMITEGVMSGMHRSPYQGLAVEFAEHRQYVPGDDPRHIDWKVYGRSDKLQLKQYQQETTLDVMLLVDVSASMRYGTLSIKKGWGGTKAMEDVGSWTKFDHATAILAALGYMCLQQRDRVGVVTFADGVQNQLKRSNARETWHNIVKTLASEPIDERTSFRKSIDQVIANTTNRSLFFIVSDFLMPIDEILESLAKFKHRRHDVVLLQTLDRTELRFDLDEPAPFVGLEGEEQIMVDPRVVRAAYLDELSKHCGAIESAARGFGYDFLQVDTHESVGPPLATLLSRRAAIGRGNRSTPR